MIKSDFYALVSQHLNSEVNDDTDLSELPDYSSITIFNLIDDLGKKGVEVSIGDILDADTLGELYESIFE